MYIPYLNRYMISYDELVDFLIYYCPLKPTTKNMLPDGYRRMGTIQDNPFAAVFDDTKNNHEYIACAEHPLKVYNDLAALIWWQKDTMIYITELYYNS